MASAFGKLAIQMAHQKGIKVACTVRREDQKEMLQSIGADLVINTEKEKLQKVIAEQTGEGVSVVFDAVGGVLGAKAIASLKSGGKMMVFGLLSLENIPLNSEAYRKRQFFDNSVLTVCGSGRISRFTEREGGAAGPAGLVQTRSRNWLDC